MATVRESIHRHLNSLSDRGDYIADLVSAGYQVTRADLDAAIRWCFIPGAIETGSKRYFDSNPTIYFAEHAAAKLTNPDMEPFSKELFGDWVEA